MYEAFGTDLKSVLKGLPFDLPTPPQIRAVLLNTAQALQHMHGLGLVHTDVKTPNMLVAITAGVWEAKLCDIGSAIEVSVGSLV